MNEEKDCGVSERFDKWLKAGFIVVQLIGIGLLVWLAVLVKG